MLPDAKNPKVNLEPEGTFTFTATGGAGDSAYELKLDLFDKVNVEVNFLGMVDVGVFVSSGTVVAYKTYFD